VELLSCPSFVLLPRSYLTEKYIIAAVVAAGRKKNDGAIDCGETGSEPPIGEGFLD
jgi:hypothetical protein